MLNKKVRNWKNKRLLPVVAKRTARTKSASARPVFSNWQKINLSDDSVQFKVIRYSPKFPPYCKKGVLVNVVGSRNRSDTFKKFMNKDETFFNNTVSSTQQGFSASTRAFVQIFLFALGFSL
jgi:hypothetical protein